MATPQEILTAAYAKSTKNQPGKIAAEATELLEVVNRVIRTFFQIGARVNPTFFGDQDDITYSAPGWARPALAESIFRIEDAGGVEVVVVPFDDRQAETGVPRVYRMGQVYRTVAGAGDPPASGDLTFFFSRRPADAASLGATIDAGFPEAYIELAHLEVAAYLANKDQRQEELAYLVAERDRWLLLFLAFLEHETVNERRRFGSMQPFHTGSLVPISSLLTGGSGVELPGG